MKFLTEQSNEVEILHEDTKAGKQMYIHGIFAQADVKNGNGRVYPKPILEAAVDKYVNEYVVQRKAIGELNHPDRPFPDPAEAAILIESLEWQGNNVVGKAKVLNTPKGLIVKALMEGGFNMGVSTRGLGSIRESNGTKVVQDYILSCVDCVSGPSGPDCYVNPIVESTWVKKNGVWVMTEDVSVFDEQQMLEAIDNYVKALTKI